jgi:hypothetical protein
MKRTKRNHQDEPSRREPDPPESPDNNFGCLLRIYWMMLGNALVAIAAYKIVQSADELSLVDLFYWVFVASLVMARYVDIRFLSGRTSEGQPATTTDWRRYSFRVLAISATVWLVAHGLSYVMH